MEKIMSFISGEDLVLLEKVSVVMVLVYFSFAILSIWILNTAADKISDKSDNDFYKDIYKNIYFKIGSIVDKVIARV